MISGANPIQTTPQSSTLLATAQLVWPEAMTSSCPSRCSSNSNNNPHRQSHPNVTSSNTRLPHPGTNTFHQLCEPCRDLATKLDDYFVNLPPAGSSGGYNPQTYHFSTSERLVPDICHLCAIVNDIWRGLALEDRTGWLSAVDIELSNEFECTWEEPTFFRVICRSQGCGLVKKEFESIRLSPYECEFSSSLISSSNI